MIVEITYFKASGKYYAETKHETQKTNIGDIINEIKDMFVHYKWPGLCDGPHCFDALINVPGCKFNVPHIIRAMAKE